MMRIMVDEERWSLKESKLKRLKSFPSPSSSYKVTKWLLWRVMEQRLGMEVVHKKEESQGSGGRGTETDLGVVHKKEEESESKPVNNEEGMQRRRMMIVKMWIKRIRIRRR
ncbi:unnamed protein product [Microthlaspi erraticum]|uniref:Uncharacterized protein n=1 Tax=Microthlaspi erraticum TaxID=1685480 RepID=A0A6D2K8C5_9BRAS|nr:unnamed protein product [Microthlaspi erraticum]